eukprot:scaffold4912_cov108-Skeletonema_menzelii.AAC.1
MADRYLHSVSVTDEENEKREDEPSCFFSVVAGRSASLSSQSFLSLQTMAYGMLPLNLPLELKE